jgi:hypothetical protein
MVEVWFKLRAGGCICLEWVTQPEAAQAARIHQLNRPVLQQPPPKNLQDRSSKCMDNLRPFFRALLRKGAAQIRGKCESRVRSAYGQRSCGKARLRLFPDQEIKTLPGSLLTHSWQSEPQNTQLAYSPCPAVSNKVQPRYSGFWQLQ